MEPHHRPPAPSRERPKSIEELRHLLPKRSMMPPPPFQADPSDIFVATYPKCGTTWMQQIVHGLRTKGSMDFEEISLAIPFIDVWFALPVDISAPQAAAPRAFKTHMTWDRVPKGARYIYVIRDPADALVSFYHFMNGVMWERDAVSIQDFAFESFFTPDQPFGHYWEHLRSFWEARTLAPMIFFIFEDMKKDLEGNVRRVANFMGLDHDEERIAVALRQSTFAFMQAHESQFDDHPATLAFCAMQGLPPARTTKVRTGRVGEGATVLSPEVQSELASWWKREIEQPLGIRSYGEMCERIRGL